MPEGGDAAKVGEVIEGRGLGTAGGQDVDNGQVAVGVDGAVEGDLGVRSFGFADGGDLGMLEEMGFSGGHAGYGAAEHHLDGHSAV